MISFDKSLLGRLQTIYMHRYEPEYAHAFADLYWRSLLILACVVIAGACAYGAIEFFGALPQSDANASAATSGISGGSNLDRTELDATLSGFAAREARFKSLQAGAIPPVVDPSQ